MITNYYTDEDHLHPSMADIIFTPVNSEYVGQIRDAEIAVVKDSKTENRTAE